VALIEAAADYARREGLANLSVDRLVAAAGVTKGAFFHHFPTRRDMVLALIAHMAERFEATLESGVAGGLTFTEALVAATFNEVDRDPAYLRTLVTATVLDPSLAPDVLARLDVFHRRMLEEGTSEATAYLVRAALDGLLQHCLLKVGSSPDRRFVDSLRLALAELLSSQTLSYDRRDPSCLAAPG